MNKFAITTKPLPHQVAAVEKLAPSKVGALFMDMGTGKSLTTMMLAQHKAARINRVVWCCPESLKINTREQILNHTDCNSDDVYVFNQKTTDANLPKCRWYVVGLEGIGSSDRIVVALNKLITTQTMLVVDESSYIKGHKAKRTKRLMLIGKRARYRYVLNGTPISQGIEDLYTQITFLSEKILGYKSWYTFARRHLEYSEKYKGMITSRNDVDWLSARISPYAFQITKDECLNLPEKTFSNRYVPLTARQEEYYEAEKERFHQEMMDLESEDQLGVHIYRLFSALQLITNGIVPTGYQEHGELLPNRKENALVQTLMQIGSKEPVVIWAKYRRNIEVIKDLLEEYFPGTNISQYYGTLNSAQRDAELSRWREKGGYFIATSSCGGHGLTLNEARYAIFYTNDFKYSSRLQAEDRMHRIGQTQNVHYIDLFAQCGIEDRIMKALERKGNALEMLRDELAAMQGDDDKIKQVLRTL